MYKTILIFEIDVHFFFLLQ